ncbi:MAG: hypothetical protein IPK52_22690 [Chloroflexi bacterium]|nr:hypothetical protein [Chloroflexota bacterium]
MFLKDRSTRTVLAALSATAAAILGVNLLVRPEGLADSMGPTFALLLGIALVLWAWNWRESYLEVHPKAEDEDHDAADSALPMVAAPAPAAVVASAPVAAAPVAPPPHAPEPEPEPVVVAAAPVAPPPPAPEPEPEPEPVVVASAPVAPPPPAPEPEPVIVAAEPEPEPVVVAAAPAAPPPPAPESEPVAASAPASVAPPAAPSLPDDFTKIEGIGKYYNDALHKIGYQSFAALSAEKPDAILAKLLAGGFRRHPTIPTWPEQAAFAARGDWDGLKALQATLVSGRKAED